MGTAATARHLRLLAQLWVVFAAALALGAASWLIVWWPVRDLYLGLGALGWSCLAPLLAVALLRRTTQSAAGKLLRGELREHLTAPVALLWLAPWILLVLLGLIALFNASYRLVVSPSEQLFYARQAFTPGLPTTLDAWASWPLLFAGSGLGLMGIAILALLSGAWRRSLLLVVFVNAIALALIGLYGRLYWGQALLDQVPAANHTFFSTFHYRNNWISFGVLSLLAGLAWACDSGGRLSRLRLLAVLPGVGVLAYALLEAGSRAIFPLGLLAGAMLVIGLKGRRPIWRELMAWDRRRSVATVLLLVLLVPAELSPPVRAEPFGALRERWEQTKRDLENWGSGDHGIRVLLARDTVLLIEDRPAWGGGLGSWTQWFPTVAGEAFYSNRNHSHSRYYGQMLRPSYAHTDWLQGVAELGLFGMAFLLWTPLLALHRLRLRRRLSRPAYFLYGGCALLLLQCVWDFPMSQPAGWVILALGLSLGLGYHQQGIRRASARGRGAFRLRDPLAWGWLPLLALGLCLGFLRDARSYWPPRLEINTSETDSSLQWPHHPAYRDAAVIEHLPSATRAELDAR